MMLMIKCVYERSLMANGLQCPQKKTLTMYMVKGSLCVLEVFTAAERPLFWQLFWIFSSFFGFFFSRVTVERRMRM